jgi:hypothetical protein
MKKYISFEGKKILKMENVTDKNARKWWLILDASEK